MRKIVPVEHLPQIELIERAVLTAAAHLVQVIESNRIIEVHRKEDHSLVMNLDLEAEAKIFAALGAALPIVSEEDEKTHKYIGEEETYLLVDPLDGTSACKRFMREPGGQVGFGPLIGAVVSGTLIGASYYSVPHRMLYTAVRGGGTYKFGCAASEDTSLPPLKSRTLLFHPVLPGLGESVVLFYTGGGGEGKIVEYLRSRDMVENAYRFGGFANDCVRVASGSEHVQIQFSVRPWDLPATLFPYEAGYSVLFDPLGAQSTLESWTMRMNNPVMIAGKEAMADLIEVIKKACY